MEWWVNLRSTPTTWKILFSKLKIKQKIKKWQRTDLDLLKLVKKRKSVWSALFRTEVILSALKAYNRMIELDPSGEQPLCGPREWKRLAPAQERQGKWESWYRKGGFDTVIFLPATPSSQLKNRYIEDIEGAGFKIKVVEQSGVTLEWMLHRWDLFRVKECSNINCLVCSTGGKGPCRSTGVTYELVCQLCRQKYVGETSRSAYTHRKEHMRALEQREQSSVMWRHPCEKHDGNVQGFTMNVTGMFQNDARPRQILESIQINKVQQDQLINTKCERLLSRNREMKLQTFYRMTIAQWNWTLVFYYYC